MFSKTFQWLRLRIRLLCIAIFFIGSIIPPYVPKSALALQEVSVRTPQFLLVEDGFLMKPSSLTRQGSRRAYAEGIIHTVRDGDSVDRLADRYGINSDTIRWANNIKSGQSIKADEELIILPVDGILHRVSPGQTLSRIAQLYDIPAQQITDQNGIEGGFLLAGQELIIPGGKPIIGSPVKVAVREQEDPRPSSAPVIKDAPRVVAEVSPGVLQKPCNQCFYTQHFHGGHYAVDMQTRGGGPIFSAEDGVVIRAQYGWNSGYGNVIEVDHGNGLTTLYAHNKEHYVKVGEQVKRGQTIAWMGNSGRVYGSTGIHVHFEVRVKGTKKNPVLYLQ
jgi:LysM repeat protein